MQWVLNTYAPVKFPTGCHLIADDEASTGLQSRTQIFSALNNLVRQQGHDTGRFELRKHDSGKPYGFLGGKPIGVSISHCRSMLLCATYTEGEIGVDVEPCDRKLHPRLRDRICHPEEVSLLPEDLCCIRMWTVKEAALKYLGTGLRMAMNKIKLDIIGEHQFQADIDQDCILVYSFIFRDHWIAVATQNN